MTIDVVISGLGVVSPLGSGVTRYYDRLCAGDIAIEQAPWPTPEGTSSWFAAVPDFDPTDWMDARVAAGTDRFAQFILAGTSQALADAGLTDLDPLRTGLVFGTGMGGILTLQRAQHLLEQSGPGAVPGKTMIKIWPNMAAAQVAMRYRLHGPSLTLCTACAASVDAIGTAASLIANGSVDVVIAGGSEGTADPEFLQATVVGQMTYGMSAPVDRLRASLPFDVDRSGIVGGEGAGVLILESREHAERRGARIYGVVRGYSTVSDSHHPSTPNPTGEWEALAIGDALRNASLRSDQSVTALYAHGTATPAGDLAEIRAINTAFGAAALDLKVTSLKGSIGHSGGAAGAMTLIAALIGMQRGEVVPTAGTTQVDPEAEFEVVLNKPWRGDVHAVQVNGFGFGGQNASLVVSRD